MLILIYKCILKTLAINGRNLITIAACFQEFWKRNVNFDKQVHFKNTCN